MAERTWYSNNLKESEALKLEKDYARMSNVIYGLNDRDMLALQFHLSYANNMATNWQLTSEKDIKQLLIQTKKTEVSDLEDTVVEVYSEGNLLRGISVNPNLVR